MKWIALVLLGALWLGTGTGHTAPPGEWQTRAEATGYRETGRYDEVVAYAQRIAQASPIVELQMVGKSPEGRPIPVLVLSKFKTFTPEAARASGLEIVLVNAGIHAGEIPGKDAGLALVRDIAITGEQSALLDHAILIFVPIFNVDGHERFGPYTRINQNGPEAQGWRTTAQNFNLNRDFLKADSPEMRVWLSLFNRWLPDLIVDTHDTDGADYQYNLTYGLETAGNLDPELLRWQNTAFEEQIFPATVRRGNLVAPYIVLRDEKDLSQGFASQVFEPRYSTGYAAIQNRPAILVETHMLKDYRNRVRATYDLLVETLKYLNRTPGKLRAAVTMADQKTVERGRTYEPVRQYPLVFETTAKSRPFTFLGVESRLELSAISGTTWIQFDPTRPKTFTIPYFAEFSVKKAVSPPRAYIVPVHLTEVIERLKVHGLNYQVLDAPRTLSIATYQFDEVSWQPAPFEGHHRLKSFKATPIRRTLTYAPGSVIVPLDQRAANVAIHLLEPEAPDSLLNWGFLDAIFEQKEYAEPRVIEKLAREMLAQDPKLRAEFEKQVAVPAFAASPERRLDFFYQRTPYYDDRLNLYPIGRILSP